jgi:metallo-beta-lactamase class B
MKKIFLGLLGGLVQISGFSQSDFETIRISKDVELIKISDNAYVHVSYFNPPNFGRTGANGLILVNKKEAFLFDSPWTDLMTKDLIQYISDSLKLKVVGFVPNHWHIDCMGGLGFLLDQKIESYANQMTIDIAKSKGLLVPKYGFNDSLQLKLGDKLIYCYYLGAAHTMDNIVVWIPSEQILFAGCMVKSMDSNDLGNIVDGDLKAYPITISKLIDKFQNAKIVIPGHGKFGGIELIKHTKDLTMIKK